MLKRILFMMITLFTLTAVNAGAEEYEYTLFREDPNTHELVAIDRPYDCGTIYDLFGTGPVEMTPLFEYICAIGMVINATNDGCEYSEFFAYPGYYVDMEHPSERNDCPLGFYCPGSKNHNLSIGNEVDCDAATVNGLEWKNDKCVIKDTSVNVGIDSEEQCNNASGIKFKWSNGKCNVPLTVASNNYLCGGEDNVADSEPYAGKAVGICKCPAGTTTGATKDTGKNASIIEQCSWYPCQPGQQLKVENGTASCTPCEAGKYCVGGLYDMWHANESMQDCPVKENAESVPSEEGSFRCAYTCPAGKAMAMYGPWYDADTDCVPCPEGYYCPGKTHFMPTVYTNDIHDEEARTINGVKYYGTEVCESGKTTQGLENKAATDCVVVHDCSVGKYWNATTQRCDDCEDGYYCPGDDFMHNCPLYFVINQTDGTVEFDPDDPDPESDYYHMSEPKEVNGAYSQCTCPSGYSWNTQNRTCCRPGEFCCPRGKEVLMSGNENVKICQTCTGKVSGDELQTGDDEYYFCPGTIMYTHCVPTDDQYYNGSACVSCGQGAEPNGYRTGCVCTNDLYEWDYKTNSCKYANYIVMVYYTEKRADNSTHVTGSHWSKTYNYADNAFEISFTPYLKGYEFTGWCREEETCSGDALIAPNTKITIDPKDPNDRANEIKYYAQMNQTTFECDEGYYLDVGNLGNCLPCPAGYWCPGGTEENPLSVTNIGKNACDKGTYNEYQKKTKKSDCLSCDALYDGQWNLTTKGSGTTTHTECGYYCEPGKYAAAGSMSCDQTCTAQMINGVETASYCPGGSTLYKEAGMGRYPCPKGLTAEDGARLCYANCRSAEDVKNDQSEDRRPTEYVKQIMNGEYQCVPCDGNIPEEGLFYYCRGGKIEVFNDYRLEFGKEQCPLNQASDEDDMSECYHNYNAGSFVNEFGTVGECEENAYCSGASTHGMVQCPLGSVSERGAETVFDCKCLSDADLNEQYKQGDVYAEKGAGLYRVDSNQYVCVNTYLSVENKTSYENPDSDGNIPNAGARAVACQWEGTQTIGSYSNCTDKAVRVCNKNTWDNDLMADNVSTTDALRFIADKFETTLSVDMFNNPGVSSVASINNIVGEMCPGTVDTCPVEYPHMADGGNYCYAEINYDENGGALPEGVENPDWYNALSAFPIVLNNPVRAHHQFDGWCLDAENTAECEEANQYLEEGVSVVKRVIPEETTGDLDFVAKWHMVCPAGYTNHDGELTEITQCYAKVEFDANKVGVHNPANHLENYSEGAITYTLAALPELFVTGYNFGGWYDNNETTGEEITTSTELMGDNTLYAKWSPITYTVMFDGNGATGGVPMESETFDYDERKALLPNSYEKENYEFIGWCAGSADCNTGDSNYYEDEEEVSNLTAEDNDIIGMFAKWRAVGCSDEFPEGTAGNCYATITYKNMEEATLPAGLSNPDVYNAEMVSEHSILLHNPEKDGYTFLGWCDNAGLTENCSTEKEIPAGSTGHKVFWAKWEPVCNSGKYLHVGTNAICLYEDKPVPGPSLVVMLGDTKYYAHMCTDCDKTMNGATSSKLHIRYNNKTYNVYDLTAQ